MLDLAVYGPLLHPDWMLADYDAYVYFYPLRAYAAAAVQEGRLPLWNPSSFLGVPFIANPQTAFFYPLTLLFYWLAVPQAYGLSLFVHAFLAGLAFYAFCRLSLGLLSPAALVGATAFMLSGVLSGQYGHLNQLSAVAWLPLVLLAADQAVARESLRLALAAGGLLGLQLLAGHPQQSYMTIIAMGLVCIWRAWPLGWPGLARAVGVAGLTVALGFTLAAVQLLPTAELAAVSVRGAGLSYRDAIADSLWPWLVARALLPGFVNDLGSTEWLGYVGVLPLVLAGIALGAADRRSTVLGLLLAALGLGLALGGANPLYPTLHSFVPGVASFRVPARWLLLYTVGAASLAALGLDFLLRRTDRWPTRQQWLRLAGTLLVLLAAALLVYLAGTRVARWLQFAWLALLVLGLGLAVACGRPGRARRWGLAALLAVVALELWLAGADLEPRRPVPVEAYAQPRDSTLFIQSRLEGGRFLSIASEDYELKESPDYRVWLRSLPEQSVSSFLVAAKRNEVLSPNLNLLYRLDGVDGYDGGLLPLRRYLQLASLFVPAERLRADGVLISRLESLPSRRLMDLLNLRIVLAGRSKDHLADGVQYDRSILRVLPPGERLELWRVPGPAYSHVGLISSLDGPTPADGTEAARLELARPDGAKVEVPLLVGRHTAASRPTSRTVPPTDLEVLRPWSWLRQGDPVEYLARIPVPWVELASLAIENTTPASSLSLRAVTLIDERDGAFTSLVLDDDIERALFFDMKVYEYPGVLGRAYLVNQAIEADDAAGLAVLASPDFDPRKQAVVEPGAALALQPSRGHWESVSIVEARPERIWLRASTLTNALLVLSDTYYPGWKVMVNGRPAKVLRVNLHFRGVALSPGEHEVVFSYEPDSLRLGAAISVLTLLLLLVGLIRPLPRTGTPRLDA